VNGIGRDLHLCELDHLGGNQPQALFDLGALAGSVRQERFGAGIDHRREWRQPAAQGMGDRPHARYTHPVQVGGFNRSHMRWQSRSSARAA